MAYTEDGTAEGQEYYSDVASSEDEEKRKSVTDATIRSLETDRENWKDLDPQKKLSLKYYDVDHRSRPTLLHKMAQNWADGDFKVTSRETRQEIVLFLFERGMQHTDKQDTPILSIAITYHNTTFIDLIVAKRPDILPDLLLSTDNDKRNCLHKAFLTLIRHSKKRNPNPKDLLSTISIITKLLGHANVKPITEKDKDGNTPIHYAMDYKLCRIPKEYKYERIITSLLSLLAKDKSATKKVEVLFNKKDLSPYSYYYHSKDDYHSEAAPEDRIITQSRKGPKPELSRTEPKLQGSENRKGDPLQAAIPTKANVPSASKGSQKPSRGLPHHAGQSLTPITAEKNNSHGEMKPSLARSSTLDQEAARTEKPEGPKSKSTAESPLRTSKEEDEVAKSILKFLKCFFIRNYTDRDAKDLLYGYASDKNLFFNASHLRGKKVDDVVRLIKQVSQVGGFEDTLSYVRIPPLASETQSIPQKQRQNVANEKRPLKSGSVGEDPKGRNTLFEVFDALVEVGVRKILRLHVEDNVDEWAHTDSAIERAIKGSYRLSTERPRSDALEVEEWDWCKPDINLDVIKYASPSVEHIHLHWSGNQTVLYGWASSENGIPSMYKSGSLSKITLHAYQGLESMERRKLMIDQFCASILEKTEHKVKVTPIKLLRRIVVGERSDGEQDPLRGEQFEKPRSDAWIEAMDQFRGALLDMHSRNKQLGESKRVRVALIDDGIDLHEFKYNNTVRSTGVSYCSGSGLDEDAWWKSTDGHGTIMAHMISRINPWVDLEVIKIQSNPTYLHGVRRRSICPKSAADAINAAVKRKADIISMSWTITDLEDWKSDNIPYEENKMSIYESNLNLLRTAITDAVKGDARLLICSAADDLRLGGDNTLPYNGAQTQILRIGSTGPVANRDQGSGSGGSITYYLPGNQVAEEQRPHSAKPIVYHNGSSVSTALAAGLASLIMYCCHCLYSCEAGSDNQALAIALRTHTNMRAAFDNINGYAKWKDDLKIVPVWSMFGEKGDQLLKAKTNQDKIKVLNELVTFLCHGVPLNGRKRG